MIQFVSHKEINKNKWDACINASADKNVFVLSWYLDVVCKNWSAFVLNDYEAVFPLAINAKLGLKQLYQPFFTRYFGMYSSLGTDEALLALFLDYCINKYTSIDFCLHENQKLLTKDIKLKEKKFQFLELKSSFNEIQKDFSSNAIRNIKKSVKSEYTVSRQVSPKVIVDLFKSTKGKELTFFKKSDYKTLILLMETCLKNKCGLTYSVVDKNNQLIAAAFFIYYNNRFVFLKSGVLEIGKTNGAMHLLFYEFIKQHCNDSKMLDFGGSSVESVARFYKNFGAKDCVYLHVKKHIKLLKFIRRIK